MTKSNFLGGGLRIFFSKQKSTEIRKKEQDRSSMLAKKRSQTLHFEV